MAKFNSIYQKCEICEKEYLIRPSHAHLRKTCSRMCAGIARRGTPPTNKNKSTIICIRCNTVFEVNKFQESKRKYCSYKCYWFVEEVSYRRLHSWVEKERGRPEVCEFCGRSGLTKKSIHWANRSHEYKKELDDWIRLCVKCHKAYDKEFKGAIKNRYGTIIR